MPHYLTHIQLTPEIIVKAKISDTYSIHRLVYDQFSKDTTSAESKRILPLWALSAKGAFNRIVILSCEAPQKEVMPCILKNRSSIEFPEKILNAKRCIFKITVNPTVKKEGKIVPIKDFQSVRSWFCEKGIKNGFLVESAIVNDIHADIFTDKHGYKVTINKAEVSGELQVKDQAKFRTAVFDGIGREKAFGCGLLQIIPNE